MRRGNLMGVVQFCPYPLAQSLILVDGNGRVVIWIIPRKGVSVVIDSGHHALIVVKTVLPFNLGKIPRIHCLESVVIEGSTEARGWDCFFSPADVGEKRNLLSGKTSSLFPHRNSLPIRLRLEESRTLRSNDPDPCCPIN
jgi:hypothetical protein